MDKQIKVSVITPVYNTEKYIGEMIESIIGQTFRDFEFILVDDCSTDNTVSIIKKYARDDQRIKLFQNEKNLGIAGNRNRGVSLAKGKYVVWADADDISKKDRLKLQYDFMESHPEVGICGGFLQFFDDTGNLGIRKYAPDDRFLRKTIFRYSPVAQPSAIIRKECLDEAGEYDLRWPPAEDLDMSFRIGTKHQFANIQKIMIRYREHPNSATFSRLKKIELSTIAIRNKYTKDYGYKMTLTDKIYNWLQFVSIFVVPAKIKIKLFNLIRNK
jgi:glycosyltransferase involved in cell wall biosynthesis